MDVIKGKIDKKYKDFFKSERLMKVTKEILAYCVELLNAKYDSQELCKSLTYAFESCLKHQMHVI